MIYSIRTVFSRQTLDFVQGFWLKILEVFKKVLEETCKNA